jgi:lysozyme
MKLSPQGLYFLAAHEGIVPAPYLDSVGVWTYGIGHAETSGLPPNPRRMQRGMPPDLDAELVRVFEVFAEDMEKFSADVNRAVTVPMEQHEFDAAVSFHFNTGAIGRATWVKSWNVGDKAAASREIMNWTKPPEIIGRRRAEQRLWTHGDYGDKAVAVYGITSSNKPRYSDVRRRLSQDDVVRLMGSPQQPTEPQVLPSEVKPPPRERGGFLTLLMTALMSLFSRKPAEPQKLGPQGFVPVQHYGRTIWVTPDVYKRDGIRMPVSGIDALLIAQERSRAVGLPLTLPTKEMVDSIHRAADVRLTMPTRGEPRQAMETYRSVDAEIERKLDGRSGLISGHKKEILRPALGGRVTIYGGMKADGSFWQPVSSVHGETYTDYSHGLRLVYDPDG